MPGSVFPTQTPLNLIMPIKPGQAPALRALLTGAGARADKPVERALRGLGATQSVFGRGDPNATVMVIGEGPGADEDRQGQPFVGKAGKLLDRMLDAAGLTGKVFITNTVFWRPPGNRTPSPQEQAVCAPFVERAFALLKPRAVLLLGAAAAKSVLQTDEGIMKMRGEWREWRLAEGAVQSPALPTLHPAFLLRQPQAKRQVWADILTVASRLETDSV